MANLAKILYVYYKNNIGWNITLSESDYLLSLEEQYNKLEWNVDGIEKPSLQELQSKEATVDFDLLKQEKIEAIKENSRKYLFDFINSENKTNAATLISACNEAKTIEELNNIDIDYGWVE